MNYRRCPRTPESRWRAPSRIEVHCPRAPPSSSGGPAPDLEAPLPPFDEDFRDSPARPALNTPESFLHLERNHLPRTDPAGNRYPGTPLQLPRTGHEFSPEESMSLTERPPPGVRCRCPGGLPTAGPARTVLRDIPRSRTSLQRTCSPGPCGRKPLAPGCPRCSSFR